MSEKLLNYFVYLENGGCMHVLAKDKAEAREEYWRVLESILGHKEGCCSCHPNPKKFDRSKWVQPVEILRRPKPEKKKTL